MTKLMNCAGLRTEELRRTFAELANKWLIMAGDIESARAMFDAAKEVIKDQD
jgi:hypothetical protein